MRYLIGFLSGVLGMLAGWFGLAMLVIMLAGEDRDGGIAMGAFFDIGPIGGVVGFILGVFLFIKLGQTRKAPVQDASSPARRRVLPIYALAVLLISGGLAYWGWFTFIRSPYLTHGYMTLTMQFKLPPGTAIPASSDDVHINIYEGSGQTDVLFGPAWHSSNKDGEIIAAWATLSMKTSNRVISITLPGVAEQQWALSLPYDPDPTPSASPWQPSNGGATPHVELSYQLGAEQ